MKIYLAPMEGVVDHHMRDIIRHIGGIDLCTTEFIRVTDHVMPRKVFLKYCPELDTSYQLINTEHCQLGSLDNPAPIKIQLLGSNPNTLALNAKKAVMLGSPGVDLNFGCPAKTVNKSRGGACLLDETELLYEIVSRVRDAVPAEQPVTVKIRLGYHERNSYIENAEAIYKAGANELVVHARSKSDGYAPPAYWACIKEIKHNINIPLVANGDIWQPEDYFACREMSGCDNVMLGRGLLSRPDLAKAIKAQCQQETYTPMTWQDITYYLFDFFMHTVHQYPKKYCGNRVKQWLFYLKRQYPQAGVLFENIKREKDALKLESMLSAQLNA